MRPKFLLLACSALLCLGLVATGCGGGGSSSDTTAAKPKVKTKPKISRSTFIRDGDAICGEVNTAIGAAGQSANESTSESEQIANLYLGMVQSLQGLGQPTETDGYSEFMGAAEELAKVEGEVKSASAKDNPALVEEAELEAVPAVEEFQSQAAVYGFEECSEGPHAPTAAPESGGVEPEETQSEESGGIEPAPEEIVPEEVAPEEEIVPEEEVAPEEVAPETGGAGGEIEEVAPEEVAPEGGGAGGIGPE
jgi:hypothetical protein